MGLDLEALSSKDLRRFAENLVTAYEARDAMIDRIDTLRRQSWTPAIPPAWQITAKAQHSSMAKDIPARSVGACAQNEPTFSRTSPDDDEKVASRTTTVERYFQARHLYDKRTAAPARNGWVYLVDQMANGGGAVIHVAYGPHDWASQPPLKDGEGKTLKALWRDEKGRDTDDEADMDPLATSKLYLKLVQAFRERAQNPIRRRYLPARQCYPYFSGQNLAAMVIRRSCSPLELEAAGFSLANLPQDYREPTVRQDYELTEVWTANRARYFVDDNELIHTLYGRGILTNYGFVPFAVQIGMPGGETEFGTYGMPVLALVETNIRLIDELLTMRYNALHMVAYPTWLAEDAQPLDPVAVATMKPQKFDIQTGMVNYFPGKKITPLLHPGLNRDFDKAINDERTEVRRIIPDVLMGIGESTGYNSALMTQQARAFFNPVIDGIELLHEQAAILEMRHLSDRVPGPVYLDLAEKQHEWSSRPRKVGRIGVEARDIGDYYGITCSISREIDRITLTRIALEVDAAGHMNREWVHDMIGGTDFEQSEAKRRRDIFMMLPDVQEVAQQKAIERFGLKEYVEEIRAKARIAPGPGGMPMVRMADGRMAGPGPQRPEAQGPAGMLGGFNSKVVGPNLAATNNPGSYRRRGGAPPGAPQTQGLAKTVEAK